MCIWWFHWFAFGTRSAQFEFGCHSASSWIVTLLHLLYIPLFVVPRAFEKKVPPILKTPILLYKKTYILKKLSSKDLVKKPFKNTQFYVMSVMLRRACAIKKTYNIPLPIFIMIKHSFVLQPQCDGLRNSYLYHCPCQATKKYLYYKEAVYVLWETSKWIKESCKKLWNLLIAFP